MPKLQSKTLTDNLPHWQAEVLNIGLIILDKPRGPSFREAVAWRETDEARAAWERHGRRLTAECAKRAPGVRPWAWWRWAYSGPRPWDLPPRRPKGWRPEAHQYEPRDPWESFRILKRLRVLLPGEQERFLAAHPGGPPPETAGRAPGVLVMPVEAPEAGEVELDTGGTIQ